MTTTQTWIVTTEDREPKPGEFYFDSQRPEAAETPGKLSQAIAPDDVPYHIFPVIVDVEEADLVDSFDIEEDALERILEILRKIRTNSTSPYITRLAWELADELSLNVSE